MKRARPLSREEVPVAPVRPTRIFHFLAGISARRLRGLSLLVSLTLMLVVSLLVAFSVLPWWNVLVSVAVLTADLAWLRRIAVSERSKRSESSESSERSERSDRSQARAGELAVGPSGPTDEPYGYFDIDSDVDSDGRPGTAGREPEPQMESGAATAAVVVEETELAMPVEPAVDFDPSSWSPVPVPLPTYTLKAKAADPVTVPAAVIEHLPGEPWSLEGMVFDCDLDELVERRSATGA